MLIQLAGIDRDIPTHERHLKAVGAAGGRAIQVLAVDVVVRAVTGTLEALAVVAEGILAAEVDTDLVQGEPVGAVAILDPVLSRHLVDELLAMQKENRSSRRIQVYDVRLGGGLVENTLLVLNEFALRGGYIVALGLERYHRAELSSEIGVQH